MITLEMKNEGISCRNKGFNCNKCKNKNECAESVYKFKKDDFNNVKKMKEYYKKKICELIDNCDLEMLNFYVGEYSNIFEEGINFSLEGSYKTKNK